MTNLFVTTRDGATHAVPAQTGISLMELIRDAGIDDLSALCGGSCSCATCHIYVEAERLDSLPKLSDVENDLLDGSEHRTPSSRLGCQVIFKPEMDGLKVQCAPEG